MKNKQILFINWHLNCICHFLVNFISLYLLFTLQIRNILNLIKIFKLSKKNTNKYIKFIFKVQFLLIKLLIDKNNIGIINSINNKLHT